jgi:hypothetical protein
VHGEGGAQSSSEQFAPCTARAALRAVRRSEQGGAQSSSAQRMGVVVQGSGGVCERRWRGRGPLECRPPECVITELIFFCIHVPPFD